MAQTKLNTNQLGNNAVVFDETNLLGKSGVQITRYYNPDYISDASLAVWNFEDASTVATASYKNPSSDMTFTITPIRQKTSVSGYDIHYNNECIIITSGYVYL